jgi:hypothetical protein
VILNWRQTNSRSVFIGIYEDDSLICMYNSLSLFIFTFLFLFLICFNVHSRCLFAAEM